MRRPEPIDVAHWERRLAALAERHKVPGAQLGILRLGDGLGQGRRADEVVIAATGTSSAVKAQAWDWSRAAWVDLAYQETGATAVPDSAVDPLTGEVRLRLSSGGQFATGWLSLAGTVS